MLGSLIIDKNLRIEIFANTHKGVAQSGCLAVALLLLRARL